jgi:uncharacterized circularly permuted ATP-grasp superfamily protein
MDLETYDPQELHDEYFVAAGELRQAMQPVMNTFLSSLDTGLPQLSEALTAELKALGATFSLGDDERVLPFDPIPRVISGSEWQHVTAGLKQRVNALNQFCGDIYGEQRILAAAVIPRDVVESARRYLPACRGLQPPGGVWCHVSGIDLVRDRHGNWCVLEDNLRVPSGIAYVLKNRQVMEKVLPDFLQAFNPLPVDQYAQQLKRSLETSTTQSNPVLAVLTPGPESSAHFEHALLAEQMGALLVEPRDLLIVDGYLHAQTEHGATRLDVVYRRGDTEMLEKAALGDDYPDSVAAIVELCQQGRLSFANALGTGIGDDKVIYAYVPDIIRFYLDEEPILPNVETYLCWRDRDREYVLNHLDELVVKAASAEGGDDMLVGINSTSEERSAFAEKIRTRPRAYMAQPTVLLSQIPTIIGNAIEGRHTDLRPYVIHQGDDIYVHPGGLTRVALAKGELVVNSSQGGGAKDTWVLTAE